MPDLKKKLGPLPVWAWGLIIGVGAYFAYSRYEASSSSSSSSTGAGDTLDSSAVDPNTGLTYGEEEQDAEQALGEGDDTGGETDTGTTTTGSTDPFSDMLEFFNEFKQFAGEIGYTPPAKTAPAPTTRKPVSSTTTKKVSHPHHPTKKHPSKPTRPGKPHHQKATSSHKPAKPHGTRRRGP